MPFFLLRLLTLIAAFFTVHAVTLPSAFAAPPKRAVKASAPAKPPPLHLVETDDLPPVVRRSIPSTFFCEGGAHQGAYWFVWYRVPGDSKLNPWFMAIWKSSGRGRHAVLRRLRVSPLPHGSNLPFESSTYHSNETEWLRPGQRSGPIWGVRGDDDSWFRVSYYVFPQGYEGPVIVYTYGEGPDIFYATLGKLGEPDARGFRVLDCSYSEANADFGTYKYTWHRYWTGKGWDKKGEKHREFIPIGKPY